VVLTSDFFCPHITLVTLYTIQFLEIKLFTFDYHENKSQGTGTKVLLDQRFISRRSSPLNGSALQDNKSSGEPSHARLNMTCSNYFKEEFNKRLSTLSSKPSTLSFSTWKKKTEAKFGFIMSSFQLHHTQMRGKTCSTQIIIIKKGFQRQTA